jgi:hypothetical protein
MFVSTKTMSFVDGIAINQFRTTERKACRHQRSGAPHGRLVALLTCYQLLQFPGQQCANAAAAFCCNASGALKKVPVNGYSDVVFAYGGHDGDAKTYT